MINGIGRGGLIDFTWMTAMRGQMQNPFEEIDSNEDGSLDKTELTSFADKISEVTGQSVDVDQLISKLDSDEDELVSQEEFESGRPQGPPPGMMGMTGAMRPGGNGMQGTGIQSALNILSNLEDEEASSWIDSLDTNGDGIVDAEEAKAGINYLIQQYQNPLTDTSNQDEELDLLG